MEFQIEIHRSLRNKEDPRSLSCSCDNDTITYFELIEKLLKPFPEIYKQVISNDKIKPGILFIANQMELNSLGILSQPLDLSEDIHIKIVPILHGG